MKKAFVFDFDDTLATTQACVLVLSPSTPSCAGYIKELSPAEFNGYRLKGGERFDFSQFRCSEKIENGTPTALMQLALDVYNEDHDVYILTARSSDVSDAIEKFLKLRGIEAEQVICVGDGDEHTSIASCKMRSLMTLMPLYDKVYFYDDDKKNIELAKEVGVKSYLV